MPIAVVLLHYNRWGNLRLALRALHEQTLPLSEFHVVVADDGSTDETVDQMRRLVPSPEWAGHLHFVSGGPHQGARISRIYNVGIANIPPDCTFFAVLASDMCLAPDALEQIARLHEQNPQAAIITRLDWLPSMSHAEIEAVWDSQGFAGLYACVPQQPMDWVGQTLVGTETRPLREAAVLEPLDSSSFHPVYGVPTEFFWRIGGFDEGIAGYGWHELDFGIRLRQQNVLMITTMQIRALHIWHPKDGEIEDLVSWQRQRNTAYVLRKHGPQPLPLIFRNWAYWGHYHQQQGGTLLYVVDGDSGLYVVNELQTHYLRLPHAGWLHRLGFSVKEVEIVGADRLAALNSAGIAEDWLHECDFASLIDDLQTLVAERVEAWRQAQFVATLSGLKTAKREEQKVVLAQLLSEYDALRARADMLPGAQFPVIGFLIRIVARVGLMGKVWAAERQFLQALLETVNERDL